MIPIKNIYYMLSYAYSILKDDKFKKVETEEFDNIFELMASIISKATNSLIKRGMARNYIARIEESSLPHGKINIAASIKSNLINKHKLICEYDDYLPDVYFGESRPPISEIVGQSSRRFQATCFGFIDIIIFSLYTK